MTESVASSHQTRLFAFCFSYDAAVLNVSLVVRLLLQNYGGMRPPPNSMGGPMPGMNM